MRRALLACVLLAACTGAAPPAGGVLAVGDSVLAWNGEGGIPESAAGALGLPVRDASVAGARVLGSGFLGFVDSIPAQLEANRGPWDWVVLNGGANDLARACGTPGEDAILDALIGGGGGGALPALVADIRRSGARVALVGYYGNPRGARTSFTACGPVLERLDARLAALAARDSGIVFVDAGGAIDPARRGLYDADLVHPSPEGSARIGRALARAMGG